MPEQFLSDFRAPKINGVAAERVLSNELLQNLFQGEIETNGKGVTTTYTNVTSGAEIRVLRVLPVKQDARELGAKINGNSFNNLEAGEVATEEVGIRILTVMDRPIDIAQVTTDMIPVDLLKSTIDNFSGLVTRNRNAIGIASKVVKSLGDGVETITYDGSSKDAIKGSYTDAANLLDMGDVEHDIDVYPDSGRIYTIRPEFKKDLQNATIFSLGDVSQSMFAKGEISPGAKPNKLDNGYLGDVYGTPAHMASRLVWQLAANYCGLPKEEFKTVVGYCASHIANSVGVAVDSLVKVDNHPYGRGVRLKPLIRFGAESWYAKGNAFITTSNYKNPFAFLKTLNPTYVPMLLAPGSRQFTGTTITVDGTTVKAVDANAYSGTKHFYAFTKDATLGETVQDFETAYETSGAKTGEYADNIAIDLPTDKGTYYLLALALAADGTATVAKSKAIKVN